MINWIKITLKAFVQYLIYLFFCIAFIYIFSYMNLNLFKIESFFLFKNKFTIENFIYISLFFIVLPYFIFKLASKYQFTLMKQVFVVFVFILIFVIHKESIKNTYPRFSILIEDFKNNYIFEHKFKIKHSEEVIHTFLFSLEKDVNKKYEEIKKEVYDFYTLPYKITLYEVKDDKEVKLKEHLITIDFSQKKLPKTKEFYFRLKRGNYSIKIEKKDKSESLVKLKKFTLFRKHHLHKNYNLYKKNDDKIIEYKMKGIPFKKDIITLFPIKTIDLNVGIKNIYYFQFDWTLEDYYFNFKKFGRGFEFFDEKKYKDLKAYFKPYLINNIYYFPYKIIIYKNTKKKEKIYETVDIKIDFTTKESFLNSRNIFDVNLEKGNYLVDVIKITDKELFFPLYEIVIKEKNNSPYKRKY